MKHEITVPGNIKINAGLIHDVLPSEQNPWRAKIEFDVFVNQKRLVLDINLGYVELEKVVPEIHH